MADRPIAWLWQNGRFLDEGCFQFYPTAERADAEIGWCGGWKTPVFVRERDELADFSGAQFRVFDGLEGHRPAKRLIVGPARAEAIPAYMQAERTGEYSPRHPGPRMPEVRS